MLTEPDVKLFCLNSVSWYISAILMNQFISPKPVFNEPVSLLDSSISFISPGAVIDIHHHHAFQICTAVNKPFDCQIDHHQLKNTWGFIVNQQIPHSCNAPDTAVAVNFIDPDSRWGVALAKMLDGAPYLEVSSLRSRDAYQHLLPEHYRDLSPEELGNNTVSYLNLLLEDHLQTIPPHADKRMPSILAYINEHIDDRISLQDLARPIHLSAERLRHLFLEQTGIPLSQYIIWKRIRGVATAVVKKNRSLTEAALEFGFTDYQHFRRIFRRMFGSAPNMVFSHCLMIL